jgi:hypothetical protein
VVNTVVVWLHILRYETLRFENSVITVFDTLFTLSPLTWKIRLGPNNASKWQLGFNWAFKGLRITDLWQ